MNNSAEPKSSKVRVPDRLYSLARVVGGLGGAVLALSPACADEAVDDAPVLELEEVGKADSVSTPRFLVPARRVARIDVSLAGGTVSVNAVGSSPSKATKLLVYALPEGAVCTDEIGDAGQTLLPPIAESTRETDPTVEYLGAAGASYCVVVDNHHSIPISMAINLVTADEPPPEGPSCCDAHDGVGCGDDACQSSVCEADPYCCDTAWDSVCSDEAADRCGSICEDDCAEPVLLNSAGTVPEVFVILDSSSSMYQEYPAIEDALGQFWSGLQGLGDVHLALMARSTTEFPGACVPPPFGSGACPDDSNPPAFVHMRGTVASNDPLNQFIEQMPNWLAIKGATRTAHIVVMTDDDSRVPVDEFNDRFADLQVGYDRFVMHALTSVGDPFQACIDGTACCDVLSSDAGLVYQELADLTGGISHDLCELEVDSFFSEVVTAIGESPSGACAFALPPGMEPGSVEIQVGGTAVPGVASSAACTGDGWFEADGPGMIELCPASCTGEAVTASTCS